MTDLAAARLGGRAPLTPGIPGPTSCLQAGCSAPRPVVVAPLGDRIDLERLVARSRSAPVSGGMTKRHSAPQRGQRRQAGCCGAPRRPNAAQAKAAAVRKSTDKLAKDPRNLKAEEEAIQAELEQMNEDQAELDLALKLSLDEMADAARDGAQQRGQDADDMLEKAIALSLAESRAAQLGGGSAPQPTELEDAPAAGGLEPEPWQDEPEPVPAG